MVDPIAYIVSLYVLALLGCAVAIIVNWKEID